ncbi:CDP-diacylglycerol--serine O-phosphatidyltransferase [Litorilituus lipolyticus]|uniref:CDP-diacylglycerol--serine O-phosphatidyltransferase n=1 Tax=Litorilituus lipolyticus TaxID=2491017 RepID=A0A502KVI2_9GAMM|nr:CDP-diacylglycerol--serine O-phosphatidyltransferase [Litorilituus lipolyticus]TPH15114.1 CDP-diacylglycerol--serine O-phosphatidyltransferase [Litorilituus lipolyticus]
MKEIVVTGNDIEVYSSPKQYKEQLLALISAARQRIFITALYVQDDEAGREILHALYDAKAKYPDLDIKVFVDFHRGQRGLIGEKESLGNRSLYLKLAEQYQQTIDIYGVAVKRKELFGVLHLKGMVFDDILFYTGASINNIYLHQGDRYRLDRYASINSKSLADNFCHYLSEVFVKPGYSPKLNQANLPSPAEQKRNIIALKSLLKSKQYAALDEGKSTSLKDKMTITPLVGYGRRGNKLNRSIRQLIQNAQNSITIFTPYFNLPPVLAKDVVKALKRGVSISLIVGDKTANDFYVAEQDKFSTICIVPYIYEMLLKRFLKKYQKFIDQGLLNVHLWKHEGNSFHLKGLVIDERFHMLTGSNLNPRAWTLDLENGLLVDDPSKHLMPKVNDEILGILVQTNKINNYADIESVQDYPEKPQKLLNKIRVTQLDKILKRFL